MVVFVELFGRDLAFGVAGEFGEDSALLLELAEWVRGVLGLEDGGGVGAGVGLEGAEQACFFRDFKV